MDTILIADDVELNQKILVDNYKTHLTIEAFEGAQAPFESGDVFPLPCFK